MNKNLLTKNIVLVLLFAISILCFIFDSIRVFGVIALFCLVLYMLWDSDSKDDNDCFYSLK